MPQGLGASGGGEAKSLFTGNGNISTSLRPGSTHMFEFRTGSGAHPAKIIGLICIHTVWVKLCHYQYREKEIWEEK